MYSIMEENRFTMIMAVSYRILHERDRNDLGLSGGNVCAIMPGKRV